MSIGFNFQLTVINIDSIKPRQGGDFKNDEGDVVVYGHAVKLKCRNVVLMPDEDFGEKEVESTLEIEIPCDSMSETVKLNNFLKDLKASKKPFNINTSVPSRKDGGYACKSLLSGDAFIAENKK